MLSATLIEPSAGLRSTIIKYLEAYCPYIQVQDATSIDWQINYNFTSTGADICFVNTKYKTAVEEAKSKGFLEAPCVFVYIAESPTDYQICQKAAKSILLAPLRKLDFLLVINGVLKEILDTKNSPRAMSLRSIHNFKFASECIGIPNVDGLDFVPIAKIIRCEGMQKCTKVFIEGSSSLISSYSIGQFKKQLEPFGFLSTHRSHLVNINKIRHYHREGVVTMSDESSVPLSRRRKDFFLNAIISV